MLKVKFPPTGRFVFVFIVAVYGFFARNILAAIAEKFCHFIVTYSARKPTGGKRKWLYSFYAKGL